MEIRPKTYSWVRAGVIGGAVSLIILVLYLNQTEVQERLELLLRPSAQRAYEYGTLHFDARSAADYDIKQAEYFFRKAESMEPEYPYLQHQLARIAFLKGDFTEALERIDREIRNNPHPSPSSFYIRALVNGFSGDYESAAIDFKEFLKSEPTNWAASNDLAWVYLKAKRPEDALAAIDVALSANEGNPWLLNSKASALYELGRYDAARIAARGAAHSVMRITESDWLKAYPGNDPRVAREGILAFQDAVRENMHTLLLALATHEVQ